MKPELSRPLPVASIGPRHDDIVVEADAKERAMIAARLGLPAVERLRCRFRLASPVSRTVVARGELSASVVQTCVVTLEDFPAEIAERFEVRFVPAGTESDDLDPEVPDDIGYVGDVIDLGEAATEQLALALDPYPRRPGTVLPEGVVEGLAEGLDEDDEALFDASPAGKRRQQ